MRIENPCRGHRPSSPAPRTEGPARTVGRRHASRAARLCTGIVALSLGLLGGAAQAALVRFNFAVDFTSGQLANQTAFGSFDVSSTDCPAFVCSGTFTPMGPANPIGATGTLLDFKVVVDGLTFGASADDGYPEFPSVSLANNVLTGIDFMDFGVAPLLDPPALSISFHSFGSGPLTGIGAYTNANFDTSDIGSVRQIGAAQAIPEPATGLLVASALVAGFWTSRRRSPR